MAMTYKVVSDALRGDPRPLEPFVWPPDLAKPAALLLEGKTLFAAREDEADVRRLYQLFSRRYRKRLLRTKQTYKGIDGWAIWLANK